MKKFPTFAVLFTITYPFFASAEIDSCDFLANKIENMSIEYALFLDGEKRGERITSKLGIEYTGISANFQYFYQFYTSSYIGLDCDLDKVIEIERKVPSFRESGESLLFTDLYSTDKETYVISDAPDEGITVAAFGLELGGAFSDYNQDGSIELYGYKTSSFTGTDESGLFENFNAAIVPTSKIVAGIYARSSAYDKVEQCVAAADTLGIALESKYGERARNVIDVSTTRSGELYTWLLKDYIIQVECRSDRIGEMPFLDIRYVDLRLIEEFKSQNLRITTGEINIDDF